MSKRFYINAALFVLLLIIGIIFRKEYAAVRDAIRSDLVGAARTVISDIESPDSDLHLPSLAFGANSEKLIGHGEKISSDDMHTPANIGEDLVFPSVMYPYRALLNADAQQIYNQVYANALAKNQERFTLVQPVSESVLSDIMNAVYNDHPELFWVDTAYSYGFFKNNSIITVTLTYNDTIADISSAEADFTRIVSAIVNKAKTLSTDIEREKFVHDYLMEKTDYDVNAPMNQSAYSALVLGNSVCAGYARAFQHILMELDIPCYYVTGTAAGGDHAWNIIALGSDYYNVDPSWNDAAGTAYGTLNYSYFNLPDSQFATDHKRSPISSLLPPCNGTLMRYGTNNGVEAQRVANAGQTQQRTYAALGFSKRDVLTSLDEYNAFCRDQLLALGTGSHTLTIVLKNTSLMEAVSSQARNKGYVDGYAQEVVNSLRLQHGSISLQLSFETLADGYILLTQSVTLTGDQVPSVTAVPTPSPTDVPTQAPTIVVTEIPETPPPPPEIPAPQTPVPVVEAPYADSQSDSQSAIQDASSEEGSTLETPQ